MSGYEDVPCTESRCMAKVGQSCIDYAGRTRDAHTSREEDSRDAWLVANGWPALGRGAMSA